MWKSGLTRLQKSPVLKKVVLKLRQHLFLPYFINQNNFQAHPYLQRRLIKEHGYQNPSTWWNITLKCNATFRLGNQSPTFKSKVVELSYHLQIMLVQSKDHHRVTIARFPKDKLNGTKCAHEKKKLFLLSS